jgi:hypothetical protein
VAGAGTSLSNYNVTYVDSSASSITPAALTITAVDQTKTYDGGLTVPNISGFTEVGLVAGQTLSGASLAYTDPNVGAGTKTIAISTAVAGAGTSLSNYNVTYVDSTASSITPAALTIRAMPQTKTYDGSVTAPNPDGFVAAGLVAGQSLGGVSLAYSDPSVGIGDKIVIVSGAIAGAGTSLANYNVTYVNNTVSSIMPARIKPPGGLGDPVGAAESPYLRDCTIADGLAANAPLPLGRNCHLRPLEIFPDGLVLPRGQETDFEPMSRSLSVIHQSSYVIVSLPDPPVAP